MTMERLSVFEVKGGARDIVFTNVSLDLAKENRRLITGFSQTLSPGDKFIMTGDSGSGKSTLIRAFRRLLQSGSGEIAIPSGVKTLCISQKAHLPRTSLRGILSSPAPEGTFRDAQIDEVLRQVGHERLCAFIPENQASLENILNAAQRYVDVALNIWARDIQRLSPEQRAEFKGYVRDFINQHAQNFFDDLIAPYITESIKADMELGIGSILESSFMRQPSSGGLFLPFEWRIRTLAQRFSKFVLQGTGAYLKESRLDGSQISKKFSGGEQQRIPFAQILLHKPDIAIIDEGTSALDKNSGLRLYEMVFNALPETIFLSVAHNTHLIPIHSLHGHLENNKITVQAITSPSP